MQIRTVPFFLMYPVLSQIAFAQGAPWVEDFSPPSGEYSWVQLTSDEWVKGEIIALYDEVLIFDSDHFDEIRVDFEDIRHVYGRGSFEVTFTGRPAINGDLQIRGDTIVITVGDERYERSRADLIAVTPTAVRELDRWAGDVGIGLNVRQGNSDIREANVILGLNRRTPVSRVAVDYLGQVNETEGVRIANSHRANVSVDRFSGGRFFWRPISVQYFQDRFQNILHQATADTGIGYQLVDTPRVEWEVQAGVGANYLRNVSAAPGEPRDEVSPVGTLGTDLSVEVTSWIDFELGIDTTILNDKSGRFQHHIVSTLSTDFIGDIDFDVSLIWDRTAIPQQQEDGTTPDKDDVRFIFSLGYDF